MKDEIYTQAHTHLVDFAFDQNVAQVFPDMIRRSVPGYELVVPMTGLIAAEHLADGDVAYDLGCSLGATTLALLRHVKHQNIRVIGVDNAPAMLEKAREEVVDPRVSFLEADVVSLDFEPAGVVLCNWLLQFVPEAARLELMTRICTALRPNGALLLSEKIVFDDTDTQTQYETLHHAFKRANGYSQLEVSQKRAALENVMVPETEQAHIDRLTQAGFTDIKVWFRCLNWLSILAIK